MRPYDEHLETGQVNYESFHHAKQDLGWVRWQDLSEDERDAWRIAAHEVMQRGWVSARHRR